MESVFFLVVLAPMLFAGCGGASSSDSSSDVPSDDPGNDSIDNDQWRSITNSGDITAGMEVDGGSGTLTVVNGSDSSVGMPSLSIYDLTAGEATTVSVEGAADVPAGETISGNFSFPGVAAPDESAFMMLNLGDGQAAVFMTADAYADLSPAILHPGSASPVAAALSAYINPSTGSWDFQMSMSASYLTGTNCPSSSPTYATSGETSFYVSNNGYSANWHADDNIIAFNRSATSNNFESPTYYFEVENGDSTTYGDNSWTMTPTSSSAMTGTLNWDNNLGCTAAYPITMDYQTPLAPTIYTLCEGIWNINYSTVICGGNIISNPAEISFLPYPMGTLDVGYDPLGSPVTLTFDTLSSYQTLVNVGGSNTYGSGFPNMYLGLVTDIYGTPLQLTGGFQMTAVSESLIYGTVTLTGYGLHPCSGTGVFTMTGPSGC